MGKLDQPGYPLPAGELGDDNIVCQLVFLPDRPEYWQAFIGAYHYMTTWRAWERDVDKRGKDAAANWREAFELTMECWRMACLQSLQDDVADILAILENPQVCCDEMDVTGGDQYTDRVTDGVGDVPQNIIDAGYADDASDWDGFDDYKCMIAHVLVDQIEVRLATALPWMDQAGKILITIGILSAIFTVILTAGGAVLAAGVIATTGVITGAYAALLALASLPDLIDGVAEHHDELACSIYQADGDDGALIALNDKIDELFNAAEALVLTNMNLGPTLKALYAGRYDQQDIADNLLDAGYELESFTCDCEQIGEFLVFTDWEIEDWQGWSWTGWPLEETIGIGPSWGYKFNFGGTNGIWLNMSELADIVSITAEAGDVLTINRIKFWYKYSEDDSQTVRLLTTHDGGEDSEYYNYSADWVEVDETFDPPLECTFETSYMIRIYTGASGDGLCFIDHITIDFDYDHA